MPSLRTMLLTLFLACLALFIVILFMKKSQPEQDAQSYTEQNPTCSEVKIHSNKNDMVECFLNFESAPDFSANPKGEDTLYIPMAKFIGERFPGEFPLRVRYIISFPSRTIDSVGISGKNISIIKGKNSVWRNEKTGCKFPGSCFEMPLEGTFIPKKFARYDNNAERDFKNKFGAIGETPVNAILPGKILKIEQDSLFSMTIYHGENIYSKTSGLHTLSSNAKAGNAVSQDIALGFLPPKDTAFIFVEITRNGKYELWDKLYYEGRE